MWRKLLPICKKNHNSKALISLSIASLISINCLHGQDSSIKMPKMPSISTEITMPSISAPVMGSSFYTPGEIYTGKKQNSKNTNKTENTKAQETQASSTNSQATSQTASSSVNPLTSRIANTLLGSASSLTGTSAVTAGDLSNLNSMGLIQSLYGLGTTSNVNAEDLTTQTMLQNILTELQELKQNQNIGTTSSLSKKATLEQNQNSAKVLRFNVNGVNILNTCRTIFFSKKETDGTFLLTGDRKYLNQNKSHDETFYILFKADGNCGTQSGYNVNTQVIQDSVNQNSLVYQLVQKGTLHADKTGNLVSVKTNDGDYRIDLLLDIGE